MYATPSSNDLQPPPYNEVVGSSNSRPAAASTQSTVRSPRLAQTPSPSNPVSISISATNTSLSLNPATSTREVLNNENQIQGRNVQPCSDDTSDRNPPVPVHGAAPECNGTRQQRGQARSSNCLQNKEVNRGNTTQQNVTSNRPDSQFLHSASAVSANDSNANSSRMRDCEDGYRDVIYHADQGLYSFVSSEGGRRAWCDIPPSLLNEDGPPPYTPAPDYPGRHHDTRRTSYRQAVNDLSPRYPRRNQSPRYPRRNQSPRSPSRNQRCREELPPSIPAADQSGALGRNAHICAPIVRYPCTCTSYWFACRLPLPFCQFPQY